MSKMLASVNSLEEALIVQQANVDIIDLKQPLQGALGALDVATVRQIVTTLNKQTPISATVGDLPLFPDTVFNAVKAMAATEVDYIKIGFFPAGDTAATIAKLSSLIANVNLIAVLFADSLPELTLVSQLKQAGFKGVMLDTMDKKKGSLTELMLLSEIQHFVNLVQSQQLLCGLAGSLRLADIKTLLPLNVNYLGFRGALCQQHNRVAQLDNQAIVEIKQAMNCYE
jgi:uncharacterized protein (UPF0264 family)